MKQNLPFQSVMHADIFCLFFYLHKIWLILLIFPLTDGS